MVQPSDTRISLTVVALGILVAALPFLFLPESSSPVAFAFSLMQGIAVLVELGVLGPVSDPFGNLVDDAVANTAVAEAFLDALLQETDDSVIVVEFGLNRPNVQAGGVPWIET
ncbi:hypothetical protein DU500_17190 (plasmid) [Haloplanus rubicundus]|uniref:Uncharacterized protein n=1 Tax=Haloplanus rubicundus TaxID=1547898 RepID=A0A345E7Q5_9EURY|nr:hypothetical protein [Haloplanus rubicundus]AXG08227.1 hypothetical protein DU500_17190 [Haloplanus rubicundus]